jgi:hypothetical protein
MEPKLEKILKREDGNRVKLEISINISYNSRRVEWKFKIYTCEPKKRTWKAAYSSDDYFFRRLPMEERKAYILEKSLDVVTAEEIYAVQLELWESLKPTLILNPKVL